MLVLGPVVDEQQDAGGRQALHEAVEQCLGLGVDPVEILEKEEQRLDQTLPEQQPSDRVQSSLSALRRVEGRPRGVLDGDVQQRQQRCQQWLQRPVQHQEFARHAFPDLSRFVALLDPAIPLEQLDDGQVRRGLPVGDRAALEHQPALGAVRPRELPGEPRFPHPGLAHHRDRLPVARRGALERLGQLLQLTVASDEAGQPTGSTGLEPGPGRHGGGQLVDRCRGFQPLHGHRPERFDLNVAFGQLQGVAGDQRGAGFRHLLHPGGEMGRLPDGGVVHVEVTADRAHDDLTGVEAHANLHGCAAAALDLVRVEVHPALHVSVRHSRRGLRGPLARSALRTTP